MAEIQLARETAEEVARRLFHVVEVPEAASRTAARHLVEADLRGVETHGLVRLPLYVNRIRAGYLNAKAEPEIVEDGPATAVVDGHHGLGQVNGDFAMRLAVEKAREIGVGAVAVRNSSHFGAAASYAILAADSGCLGLATTNSAPLLAPVGGLERRVGNNPLAIAAPSGEGFPVVLDIAMSAVAAWRIRMATERGEKIPPDWAFDKRGEPTTDAYAAFQGGGLLRPLGDHKGVGLALMMDVLSGILSGGGFGTGVRRLDQPGYLNTSHFFLAINISRFMEPETFTARMSELAREFYNTPTREGVEKVLLPGELEARIQARRMKHGIPYRLQIYEPILELAGELGVKLPIPLADLQEGARRT